MTPLDLPPAGTLTSRLKPERSFTRFHVPDMSCGHCTAAIAKEIAALDPRAKVNANIETHTIDVVTQKSGVAVVEAIKIAGYVATVV